MKSNLHFVFLFSGCHVCETQKRAYCSNTLYSIGVLSVCLARMLLAGLRLWEL